MDGNNLDKFRKEWIDELDNKTKISHEKQLIDKRLKERYRETIDFEKEEETFEKRLRPTIGLQDSEAADVNDDLNSPFRNLKTLVSYCGQRKTRLFPSDPEFFAHKKAQKVDNTFGLESWVLPRSSSGNCKEKPHKKENVDENFLEILIADIDELVSLPFFDLELPKEIAIKIFTYLSIKDLGNCACVNTKWKVLADDDLIWYHMCRKHGYVNDKICAADKEGWKELFQIDFQKEKMFECNWKQRICQVSELEYEKGGILYAASVFNGHVIAGYANGLIKLWDVFKESPTASFGYLLSESQPEREIDSSISCVAMNDLICIAGYNDGNIRIWQNGLDFPLIQSFGIDTAINNISASPHSPSIISTSNNTFRIDAANENGQWSAIYQKTVGQYIRSVHLYDGKDFPSVIHTQTNVELYGKDGMKHQLESTISADISAIECKEDSIKIGVTPMDFSILDGYRIKTFSPNNGYMTNLMKGPHCKVTCLCSSTQGQNIFAVGCSDKKIRIHDFRSEYPVSELKGLSGPSCSLQIDDWKVVSGDTKGFLSVWDQRGQSLLWQTSTRHPVRLCKLVGPCLICVSLPTDRNPKETYWYADDLIQHRRHRGNIRVFDFSVENNTTGIPDICLSNYDDFSGYNYNINFVTPYDDILS